MTDLSKIVKPLEWGASGFMPGENEWFTEAKSVVGTYRVLHEHSGCYVSLNLQKIAGWNNLWDRDEAKAAAQADNARRILSAINLDVLAACVREGLEMGAEVCECRDREKTDSLYVIGAIDRSQANAKRSRALSTSPEAISDAITAAVERAAGKGGE